MAVMRLADIAAHAGVSEATVSRVLNGKPGVAPATRQAVLTALDVLGYERPARLRQQRAGLIGLIVPELTNPIFPAFAQVIENALALAGYTAVLCTQTPGGITEDDYTELLLERGVSGIIFVSGLHADSRSDRARYLRLVNRGLPIVLINGYRPDISAPFISNDDIASLRMAVGHLASLGHRRIGLAVGQERFVPSIRKTEGFRRGMAEHLGVTDVDDLIVNTLFTVEGGQAAAQELIDRGCTAICCGSDIIAIGAIRGVRQRHLRVPEDVSVVGFDDSPMTAYLDPPLTTVRQPVREMGLAAVGSLLEEIGGARAPRTELLYRPELVVRGSTAPAPAELSAVADV
ncbi:LacI family DNA-binding transcriptional regulator [Thermomonospora cellulosilytica]|uniref:DNA-binding LacI/PurR family transcriptional regulator n=1 Tax=Thermomonospora cellulosilytica TaxID=1411118 RepID=A0A7W3MZ65_9ACTN|nr:LacI family DNA-binding transcriptional regulator [Thermomonospora cellulosilytica]MBA9004583.1 DNA-binding LacI/PurR family transcriptional regulator [Thermomonospora cellulosilytica]